MHELTKILPKNSNLREKNSFGKNLPKLEMPYNDQVPVDHNIKEADHNLIEPMAPKHDPHFHQATPQANPATIRMAPNPDMDLIQEKDVNDEIEDPEVQLAESPSKIITMDGGDDEEDNNDDNKPAAIQPKLKIGQPGDKYEQESDAVADRVMRMSDTDAMHMQSIEEVEKLLQPKLLMPPEKAAMDTTIQMQAQEEEEESIQMMPESQRSDMFGNSKEIENSIKDRIESHPPPIQLQINTEEPGNEETSSSTTSEQVNPPAPQAQVCDRTLTAAELQQREGILQDFTRELQVNQSVRNVLISSLCDFSINQLVQMRQAGLRIWYRGSLPPVFLNDNIEIDTSQGGHASYVRGIRTIFLGQTVNPGYLTHEMAHAWDHIRNLPGRHRVRLDTLERRRRLRLVQNAGRYLSETNRRQQLSVGGTAGSRGFTFGQMYQNYLARLPRRELAFSRASEEGYSRESAQEFYAEGYAVFHSTNESQQAKLYKYARELYIYLNDEANNDNMPVPNLRNIIDEARRLQPPR